jgi:ankyrin repeat protein
MSQHLQTLLDGIPETCADQLPIIVNRALLLNKKDQPGKTQIMYALRHTTSTDILEELLKTDYSLVDTTNNSGRTPLHLAAIKYKPSSAKVLMNYGAKLYKPDKSGNTPLHILAINRSVRFLAELLDCWRDNGDLISAITHKNRNGNTVLHELLLIWKRWYDINMMELVIRKGITVLNTLNNDRLAPINIPVYNINITKMLIKYGTNPEIAIIGWQPYNVYKLLTVLGGGSVAPTSVYSGSDEEREQKVVDVRYEIYFDRSLIAKLLDLITI